MFPGYGVDLLEAEKVSSSCVAPEHLPLPRLPCMGSRCWAQHSVPPAGPQALVMDPWHVLVVWRASSIPVAGPRLAEPVHWVSLTAWSGSLAGWLGLRSWPGLRGRLETVQMAAPGSCLFLAPWQSRSSLAFHPPGHMLPPGPDPPAPHEPEHTPWGKGGSSLCPCEPLPSALLVPPVISPASRSVSSLPTSTISWLSSAVQLPYKPSFRRVTVQPCADTSFPLIYGVSGGPAVGVFLSGWKGSGTLAHHTGSEVPNVSSPWALLNVTRAVLAAVTGPVSRLSCPRLYGSTPEHSTRRCQE